MKTIPYLSGFFWVAATIMGFVYPQTEQTIGEVQRLFYIHFGTFYAALVLMVIGVICGIAYLLTKRPTWDYWGAASLEIGTTLLLITIVTGMFVAKPVWGVYWTWDPRLTSVAVMFLTYAAYFFLRAGVEDLQQRRSFSAVYAILAFATTMMSFFILYSSNGLSSPILLNANTTLSPRIFQTIVVNIGAYVFFALVLTWYRAELEHNRMKFAEKRAKILENL